MDKLNDSLRQVRIGEDEQVPIETNNKLWFLWVYGNNEWDAERITRTDMILEKIRDDKVKLIFCNWHGQYRTDLFLMDKNKLIKRFENMLKK